MRERERGRERERERCLLLFIAIVERRDFEWSVSEYHAISRGKSNAALDAYSRIHALPLPLSLSLSLSFYRAAKESLRRDRSIAKPMSERREGERALTVLEIGQEVTGLVSIFARSRPYESR